MNYKPSPLLHKLFLAQQIIPFTPLIRRDFLFLLESGRNAL